VELEVEIQEDHKFRFEENPFACRGFFTSVLAELISVLQQGFLEILTLLQVV
jgi:hypothetical protein